MQIEIIQSIPRTLWAMKWCKTQWDCRPCAPVRADERRRCSLVAMAMLQQVPHHSFGTCYGDYLEGNDGHHWCPRMGSIDDGDGRLKRSPSCTHCTTLDVQWQPLQRTPFGDCICVFVWSVHGALLLPTIWGLPLCVFVCTYGVLLVPVCMHSDYECSLTN